MKKIYIYILTIIIILVISLVFLFSNRNQENTDTLDNTADNSVNIDNENLKKDLDTLDKEDLKDLDFNSEIIDLN